jgi:SAM-dependent methyltransferase
VAGDQERVPSSVSVNDEPDGNEQSAGTRLAQNYSGAADGYAKFWSPVICPVGRRLLDALPFDRASRILDVGTGTGALIPDIRERAPRARIVGVDRSFGMLARAARTGVDLAMMDAARLGLRTDAFDVAVMAFVLFHIPEPLTALAELRRVLRRRGALGIVTWAEETSPRAGEVWEEELAACGACDPSPMPPRRHDLMNTSEKVTELLRTAAFVPIRVWIERIEHHWDVTRFMALHTRFGETKRKLETLHPGARDTLLVRISERMARLGPADFLYRGSAICAVAAP